MEELENILKEPECVAVGECGLDYTKDFSPRDVQRMVFERQVSIDYSLLFFETSNGIFNDLN